MGITALAPKKFLYYFSLRTGALSIGIGMCIIFVFCTVGTICKSLITTKSKECPHSMYMNARTFCVTAAVFSVIMLLVNLWFVWGTLKKRASVVLAWVVIMTMWLVQTICLLVVSICVFAEESTAVEWIISLVFAVVAIVILVYSILVGLGYSLELKHDTESVS